MKNKIEYMLFLNDFVYKKNKKLSQVSLGLIEEKQEICLVNSLGTFITDFRPRIKFSIEIIIEKNKKLEKGYDSIGGLFLFEHFKKINKFKLIENTINKTELLFNAINSPDGKMTVVLSGKAGGTMIHEACGHGLEGDIVAKNMSIYCNKLNKKVASNLITVIDDGSIKNQFGSSCFDDEGTKTKKNILIEKGILKKYLCDLKTSMKFKTNPTGNGRREGYYVQPITRMTNTYIAPGNNNKNDIINSVNYGLFVNKMGGGQVNTITGDFVFEVSEGYLIKGGMIKDQVKGATLIGNGPEVLNSIDMVGDDLGYSIGICGKDGQCVPVSDGQPTLRIPLLTVGGIKK